MKSDDEAAIKFLPTDPNSVLTGDVVAIVTYAKVNSSLRFNQSLHVSDLDRDTPFEIKGDELIKACLTADRFTEEVKVPRTKIAEILTRSFGVPFTVCFDKDSGEERVLRGRMVEWESMYGRSRVEDLDIPRGENRLRLVDHRTLKWLIVRGVKYISNSRK